jgi:hypothetical protein
MTWLDWILAAHLLTCDAPTSLGDSSFPFLRWPMLALAVEWELLDPRETKYILAEAKDFATDLALIRKRQAELVDAPRLVDAERFPDRAVVNELLAFNRDYRNYLEGRQRLDYLCRGEYRRALIETDLLFTVWDAVRDARCDYYFVPVRRQALKRLREILPDEDYYAGRLPPHVPLWRFVVVP